MPDHVLPPSAPAVPLAYGLYGILTSPAIGYVELARVMVACGLRFVQLRIKDAPDEPIRAAAEAVRAVVPAGSFFIVNDRPDIARDVGADGVHVGQDDMSVELARAVVGAGAIIGLSTHSQDQTHAACAALERARPSYIGVGPVYATPTKTNPDPTIGIDGMRSMLAIADAAGMSAVALGGIDDTNIRAVFGARARNICAVRYINQAPTAAAAERAIKTLQAALAG